MFQGKKPKTTTDIATLVGKDTTITGDIRFAGGLHVDGIVVGNVESEPGAKSVLTVGDGAAIEGEVRVAFLILNGVVKGDIYVSETVELQPNARVSGNIYYNRLEMELGAAVNGQLIHQDQVGENGSEGTGATHKS